MLSETFQKLNSIHTKNVDNAVAIQSEETGQGHPEAVNIMVLEVLKNSNMRPFEQQKATNCPDLNETDCSPFFLL